MSKPAASNQPRGRLALSDVYFPPFPVRWPTLSGEEPRVQLGKLAEWTDWLVERYSLDHRIVPPCWREHGAVVEELSALRTGWIASYCETANLQSPLGWHAEFAAARDRLTDWIARTGCRPGEHRPDG